MCFSGLSECWFVLVVDSSGAKKCSYIVSYIRQEVMLDFFKATAKMLWENKHRFHVVSADFEREQIG